MVNCPNHQRIKGEIRAPQVSGIEGSLEAEKGPSLREFYLGPKGQTKG